VILRLLRAMRKGPVTDTRVTYDYNGETIDFSQWADDAYGIYYYTSRDGSAEFEFELWWTGYEVRIFILKQPSYQGRPNDGHSTHRLGLASNPPDPYVCIKPDLTPTNVPDALSWAIYWAEETVTYIRTGRAFS
jgi:hypothetical protein